MLSDSQLKAEFRAALEAVTPQAPWLAASVHEQLHTRRDAKPARRPPLQLRMGLNFIAILVLIALAIAAIGVFLAIHRGFVPAHPGGGPVIFPTKMVNTSTGWAWLDPSELWRTTDGGANWREVTPPTLPGSLGQGGFTSFFLDANHAWIAAASRGGSGNSGYSVAILSTADGGRTWKQGASVPADDPAMSPPSLYFLDSADGWLLLSVMNTNDPVAPPTIYRTSDGGLSWSLMSSSPGRAPAGCGQQMSFADVSTGWLAGICDQNVPNLLVTHNSGVTWQAQPLPLATLHIGCPCAFFDPPHFFDRLHGSLVLHGSPGALLVTSDGGRTWSARSLPGEAQITVDFVDLNHGWAIAGSSDQLTKTGSLASPSLALPLYHTSDGGLTWTLVPTDLLLQSADGRIDTLYFVDVTNGFAIRVNTGGASQSLKTTDGGRTWTVIATL